MSPPIVSEGARVSLPIVLVGPMGAGKSRVGHRLAASADAPFIDTDQRIVERYGPIEEIFEREGEEYFRIVEREVVAEAMVALTLANAVLEKFGGDSVAETRRNLESYLASIPDALLTEIADADAARDRV